MTEAHPEFPDGAGSWADCDGGGQRCKNRLHFHPGERGILPAPPLALSFSIADLRPHSGEDDPSWNCHTATIDEWFGKWWGRYTREDFFVVNLLPLITGFAAVSLAISALRK